MTDPKIVAQEYFEALEQGDEARLESLLHANIVHREFPNRLNPKGVENDRAAMLEASRRGTRVLFSQKYEIKNVVAQESSIALEVAWQGTLAVPIGERAPGDILRATFAVFLELRDGQIIGHRNYDCFEPF